MGSVLKQLQADILGTLNGCDYLDDVLVIADDQADIAKIIQKALGTASSKDGTTGGVCIIIEEPEAAAPTTLANPYLTMIRQKVTVLENMLINRSPLGTGKTCYVLAEVVHELLFAQQFAPVTQGQLLPGTPAIRPMGVIDHNQPAIVGVECNFEAHAPLPQPAKCADPTIEVSGGEVTITSTTAGAAIFYSLDGSTPSVAYTDPFTAPASGTLIRAFATYTGFATSNTVAETIS